ncbi:MAG: transketolase [Deltaproteobacteria bacterium]|nr:transketolase [Deltaproteobacteria bacterium]
MASGGGCFLGASLSCTDLLVYLYARVLRLSPARLQDPTRDYLLLSKGHDVPALYGTLAELGYFDPGRLSAHLQIGDHVYWHPNRAMPGVEFHSGSLGHLLSVGMGIAMDAKMTGSPARVFVIAGDGELNEGSMWEGALVAAAKKLDNLVLVVDRNGFQANVATENLIPLEPLTHKLSAFGFSVISADGHDFRSLENAFGQLPRTPGRPTAVVARTVRGKGIPSIEARADRWFVRLSDDEVESLLVELQGGACVEWQSPGLVVR